jgi:hypothetical protein
MDDTRTRIGRHVDIETHILSCIVDAMLSVQADLQEATGEAWTRTLIDSCRRQKQLAGTCRTVKRPCAPEGKPVHRGKRLAVRRRHDAVGFVGNA